MRTRLHALVPLALVLLAVGCARGRAGLKMTLLEATASRPSNVAVYFTVDTADGEPVPGLTAESFAIYEDGQPISKLESKQTILNPEVAAAHYTLLLIDMSGSVTESGDVPVIVDAAQAFGDRVQKYQKVAVYAFDGSSDIKQVTGFTNGPALASGIERLSTYKARDPSTNLNGAILEALKALDRQMRSSPTPLTFGTLVVFTDGTDRAARVPRKELHEAIAQAEIDILVVGVGAEVDGGELRRIGRDGAILSKDRSQIAASFEQAASRVESFSKRYYLLSYCTPARAGEHEVTIRTSAAGKGGALKYKFEAQGFGPNCDPNRKPSFNMKRPRMPAPAEGEDRAAAGRIS